MSNSLNKELHDKKWRYTELFHSIRDEWRALKTNIMLTHTFESPEEAKRAENKALVLFMLHVRRDEIAELVNIRRELIDLKELPED